MKYILALFGFLLIFSIAAAQPIHSFNPEQATRSLINTIPLANRIKTANYQQGGYWLLLWNFVHSLFTAWLLLYCGLSGYFKKLADKAKSTNGKNLIYITLYFVLVYLVSFPLNLYQNFFRERQYGLLNQDFTQWLCGDLLNSAIMLVVCAPCFVLAYAVLRKVKENRTSIATAFVVLCLVIYFTVYPVFIAPLLTQYTPLKNARLNEQLLSMARANDVKLDKVYIYNESSTSTNFNAYVTGFGGAARIAINDNMINHATDQEIKAVIAHEMGHYVLNHPLILILEFGLLFFVGFKLMRWQFYKLMPKYGKRWHISSITDVASLPLLMLLFSCYFFIITPVSNTVIRTTEIEADNYGLNAAREPDAFAGIMLKSAGNHKIEPGFLEEIFFLDHPGRKNRIMAAMKWKKENQPQKIINATGSPIADKRTSHSK